MFGPGSVDLRSVDGDRLFGRDGVEKIRAAFGLDMSLGPSTPEDVPHLPSAESLARGHQLNALFLQLLPKRKRVLPRQLWMELVSEVSIEGPSASREGLGTIDDRFRSDLGELADVHPAFDCDLPVLDPDAPNWAEVARGFQALQYLLNFLYRIGRTGKQAYRHRTAELRWDRIDRRRPNPSARCRRR